MSGVPVVSMDGTPRWTILRRFAPAALATWLLSSPTAFAVDVPFQAPAQLAGMGNAASAITADLDGDGDLDVIAAPSLGPVIILLYNNGNSPPTWTQQSIPTTLTGITTLIAADLDGDGDQDVITASQFDETIMVYENRRGTPTQFSPHQLAPIASNLRSVYAADLDSDGDLDVAAALDYGVVWYMNPGNLDNWFENPIDTLACDSVFAADIDGDGNVDVQCASSDFAAIAWFRNTGGPIPSWTPQYLPFSAFGARSVFAADLDGDGDTDLLAALQTGNMIVWYQNNGTGFSWTPHTITSSVAAPVWVFAADVDGDGDLDALSASQNDNKIAWYENLGGLAPPFSAHDVGTVSAPVSVVAADLDGDGDTDVLSAAGGSGTVAWHQNRTIHRSATFPGQKVISTAVSLPRAVIAADLDGDGDLDALSASQSDGKIAWYPNTGAGSFGPQQVIYTALNFPTSVFAADLDNDGDMDVLATIFNVIQWFENSGTSPPTWTVRTVAGSIPFVQSAIAADLDGDGDLDVLSGSQNGPMIWFQNNGASPPSWTAHTFSSDSNNMSFVLAADLDRDGDLDVLSASYTPGIIWWFKNLNGAGTFGPATGVMAPGNPRRIIAVDLDGDGDLDVLSGSESNDSVLWSPNLDGAGTFGSAAVISSTNDGAAWADAADLDGDGDLDVLAASQFDNKIAWYENNGAASPVWTERIISTTVAGAFSIVAADFDRDGDLDVLSGSLLDNTIAWYPNRGGQFALATTNVAPPTPLAPGSNPVLKITATHRGRPGDTALQLASLDLLFEQSPGDPLTTAEANALIDNLYVYLDNGDGVFGAGDVIVATEPTLFLTAGRQKVIFATSDSNLQVAYGTPRTYFVALQPAPGGSGQFPNDFRVTHVTESSSTAVDASTPAPILLSLEFVPNVASGFVGFPPQVVSVVPLDNTLNVPVGENVTVVFLEAIDPATVLPSTLRLLDASGTPVPAGVALAPDGKTATLDPTGALSLNTLYTVDVTSGVKDLAGFGAVPFTSRFATGATPVTGTLLPSVSDQSVLPTPLPGPGGLKASASLLAASLGPNLGYSVSGAGDLNHDLLGDFVGGAPGYSPSGLPEAGAVAIYMGSNAPDPPSGNNAREVAEIIYTGQTAHERAGSAVASGFDFNGDGTGDILIGAEQVNRTVDPPQVVGTGRVYLIYFKPLEYDFDANGVPDYQERSEVFVPLSLVGTSISGVVLSGVTAGDQVGYAVAGGGFLESSDTKDDVVIGAPGSNTNNGKVYVLFSGSSLTGTRSLGEVGTTLPGTVYVGSSGERLGSSVALPGDVTAPLGPDIAMGAPLADTTQPDAGRVYIAAGGNLANGMVNASSIVTRLDGDQACEEIGFTVAGGGDNRASGTPQLAGGDPDLLVGAPYFDAVASPGNPCLDTTPLPNVGRVIQTTGRLPNTTISATQVGSSIEGITWRGVQAGGGLGWAVGRLGDLSGNRLDDIGLSAPFVNPGTSGAGAVYVIEGSANTGLLGSINADQVGQIVSGGIFLGAQTGEEAGLALCAAGDLDGDGLTGSPTAADFTVGSPGWDAALGTVHQVLGTLLQQPGECTALGCTVADLSTGAVLTIPPNALASGIKYRFAVAGQAAPPAACGSHSVSGKSLIGSSSNTRTDCGTPPCTPPSFAIGPNIEVPTQSSFEYQLTQGESLALRYCDSTLGWRTPSSGPTTGTLKNNSYLAGRKAAASNGVDSLRQYGVFFDDADHDDVRDTCDCSPTNAALWSAPGPAGNMTLSGQNPTTLTWALPDCPGGASGALVYDTIRSTNRADFVNGAVCVEANGTDLTSVDTANPPLGQVFFYIVSPENGCAAGSSCQLPACAQTPARDC